MKFSYYEYIDMFWQNMMNGWSGNGFAPWFGFAFLPFIWILVIVDLILRGYALWLSARRGQNVWFIALLIISTGGILPLIYILLNRNKKKR